MKAAGRIGIRAAAWALSAWAAAAGEGNMNATRSALGSLSGPADPAPPPAVAADSAAEALSKGPAAALEAAPDPTWVRVGVIVASRRGLPEDKPLRYAYQDGEKLERLLATLGQVGADNLFFLKAERRDALQREASKAGERIAALKREGKKVFLQFYYTGHGAARNFHFSDGPLGFDVVKEALGGLQADARVYVLDVCYGASFFTAKGFRTAPPVQLQMEMDKSAKGEVTISSSAGDEQAYEVRTLGGSIFTSHWIMALRGAGDRNRDGQVTLFEAYNYAYDRTSGYSAETLARPQHPSFQIDLTGARDVMLARLLKSSTGLLFRDCPPGNYNVLDLGRGHQIGELRVPTGEEFTLALEKGRYRVQYLPAKGRTLSADVDLPSSGMTPLPFSAFAPVEAAAGQMKGPGMDAREGAPLFDPMQPTPANAKPLHPGENRWRFSALYGLGIFRDSELAGNFQAPSEVDDYFGLGGSFQPPDFRGALAFDLGYSPGGLWMAGMRFTTSSLTYVREAAGREPLTSLPDSARAAYPVNLRWESSFTDASLVFYAGRSFPTSATRAFSVELGAGWVGRTGDMERSVERALYRSTTRSSEGMNAEGWRAEAALGYWIFRAQDGFSRTTYGLGVRLSPWYQAVREDWPDAGRPALHGKEMGVSLGLMASLGRRRLPVNARYP